MPVLNSKGKSFLIDPDGKELPKDDKGDYLGVGTQKFETTKTDSTDDPLTDEAGNVVTAGNVDALFRAVKAHFAAEEFGNVEILEVRILETLLIRSVTGEEFAKL